MDIYGMKRLLRPEEWVDIVSRKNRVPKHSAYELAYKWQSSAGFPPAVKAVLTRSADPLLASLEPEVCIVEQPVYLDTRVGPSFTDAMVYCRADGGRTAVLAVEGKARESFGPVVKTWVRGETIGEGDRHLRPSRVRRLEFLESLLGIRIGPESLLRCPPPDCLCNPGGGKAGN